MMSGSTMPNAPSVVPPQIPAVAYHIAVNGQAMGPFNLATLTQMAAAGTFTKDSLVWKQGMAEWVKANTVEELKGLLNNVMPPVPPLE